MVGKCLSSNGFNEIKLGVKPVSKVERYESSMKARVSKIDDIEVVYKVNCLDCEGCYIGQNGYENRIYHDIYQQC